MKSLGFASGVAALLAFAAGATSALAADVRIRMVDMAFVPSEVTVRAGDTVEWVNEDILDHTATDKDDKWNVDVAVGKIGRIEMRQAGTFAYYCRFHPNMTGTIHVTGE